MKTFQQLRRQSRPRRMVAIKPRAENNQAALRDALGYPVQTKLKVGAPDDAHEREADAVAARVMAAPEGVQRKCENCEKEDEQKKEQAEPEKQDEEIQRKETGGAAKVTNTGAAAIAASRGGGQPLPASERAFFEPRMGVNLGPVRIHADAQAARLSADLAARAFTVGGDVYFARGEYQPGTNQGRALLAHELAHVAQQGRGEGAVQRKIDRVDVKKNAVDLYFSLGLYGPNASAGLAATWAGHIQKLWSRRLKISDMTIDAKIHVDAKAYPALPDSSLSPMVVPESNAVYVENKGVRSFVSHSCLGHEKWSCGRWRVDAEDLVVAHETGHMMGLDDKYLDVPWLGTLEIPGYEKDIMANYWNDNGKTDFSRGWLGVLMYYYFGMRS